MLWVGQAHKREAFLFPGSLEGPRAIRAHHQDLGLALDKALIILAQLRQVPAAEGSDKAAVKDQHYVLAPAIIGQAHGPALGIGQAKIRGANSPVVLSIFFTPSSSKENSFRLLAFRTRSASNRRRWFAAR